MKKLVRTLVLIIVLAGLAFGGYFAVKNKWIRVNQFFVGNMVKGVDVSSYQTEVDFQELARQGVRFAFIKATEGSSHQDPTFDEKWAAGSESAVKIGAYHYFSYQSSGATQAENFIQTVGPLDGRLIPAVDMELTVDEVYNPPEVDTVVRGLKAFLAVVEEEYGVKPLIYCKKDYYDKYLAADFSEYPKWVRNVNFPVQLEFGDDWTVWQYDDRGVLSGYGGEKYIDLNVVNGLERIEYK